MVMSVERPQQEGRARGKGEIKREASRGDAPSFFSVRVSVLGC
jgi:hypothetical protein